jgi:hypothetical protein
LEERKTSPIFLSNKAAAPKYEMLFLLDWKDLNTYAEIATNCMPRKWWLLRMSLKKRERGEEVGMVVLFASVSSYNIQLCSPRARGTGSNHKVRWNKRTSFKNLGLNQHVKRLLTRRHCNLHTYLHTRAVEILVLKKWF